MLPSRGCHPTSFVHTEVVPEAKPGMSRRTMDGTRRGALFMFMFTAPWCTLGSHHKNTVSADQESLFGAAPLYMERPPTNLANMASAGAGCVRGTMWPAPLTVAYVRLRSGPSAYTVA